METEISPEMIERVARALFGGVDRYDDPGVRESTKNLYRFMARAAIEAMQE